MQKWEYLWIYLASDPSDKTRFIYIANGKRLAAESHGAVLNIVGKDGWELVAVTASSQAFPQFYLKRPFSN
jgi:hypothetical protein